MSTPNPAADHRPSNHRTLPRRKQPPSLRDQGIFLAYRTSGRTQASLAAEYKVSQRRISQIVQRVERWRNVGQTFLSAVGWAVPTPADSAKNTSGGSSPSNRQEDEGAF